LFLEGGQLVAHLALQVLGLVEYLFGLHALLAHVVRLRMRLLKLRLHFRQHLLQVVQLHADRLALPLGIRRTLRLTMSRYFEISTTHVNQPDGGGGRVRKTPRNAPTSPTRPRTFSASSERRVAMRRCNWRLRACCTLCMAGCCLE
jgi:hypothetical protein